jgi:hypothetical protein
MIKDWLFQDSLRAEQAGRQSEAAKIASNAAQILKTRLRPEATYCYLARLVESLANVQERVPDIHALERMGIPSIKWIPFEEYAQYSNG